MRWTLMLAVAVALVVPSMARAHEGHAHKTLGTVTMVHENHVEVQDAKGVKTTFELSPTTKIMRGKTVAKLADLKVGDRVSVTATQAKGKDGKMTTTVSSVVIGTAVPAAAKK